MTNVIRVDPRQLQILDPYRFTLLLNDLIHAEAYRLGVPNTDVDTTVAMNVPDGGIDARARNTAKATRLSSQFLPPDVSAWQFKAGRCPSLDSIYYEELNKPEVVRSIQDDQCYCFVTASLLTATQVDRLNGVLATRYLELDREPNFLILSAERLARWVEQYLAIAHRHFNLPLRNWETIEQWRAPERLRNAWQPDSSRQELIDAVQAAVSGADKFIFVSGYAGMGKTRTVLEAVSIPGIQERVLYLDDAARFEPDFFWYLKNQHPDGSGILVIDECTSDEYQSLQTRAEALPSGYTVIAVGPKEASTASNELELGQLGIEPLSGILSQFVPGLSDQVSREIARRCGGSPKLAVLLASTIRDSEGTLRQWEELERNPNVLTYVNNKLFPVASDEPEARLMRGLCLFTRVGWERELAAEGQYLAQFLDLPWERARTAARSLVLRGVVSPRGRYLYPTPDILANYLTRETVSDYGSERLRALFDGIQDGARGSFAERLRQLGEESTTRAVVNGILGDSGFFQSLQDLSDRPKARLLQTLAPAFPETALRSLNRLLTEVPPAELASFSSGRREIVWSLEALAWWPENFAVAARLLLRLAVGENESIENSATGTFVRLFQVLLAGTALPYDERLPVLDEAVASADIGTRLLAVKALAAALQTQHIHRIGGPPSDLWRLPPHEWRPSTYGQWANVLRACLARVAILLNDTSPDVRTATVDLLAQRASDLMSAGLTAEWANVAEQLQGAPFSERDALRRSAEWRLAREEDLNSDDRNRLLELVKKLAGYSLEDRLKRVVGPPRYEFHTAEQEHDLALAELAVEIVSSPKELSHHGIWLVSGEAGSSFEFGRALAYNDPQSLVLAPLVEMSGDTSDDRLLSGYLIAGSEIHGQDWLRVQLARLGESAKSFLMVKVLWRTPGTDYSARTIARCLNERLVPAAFLIQLSLGSWSVNLSPSAVAQLVDSVSPIESKEAGSGQLLLLNFYLDAHPEHLPFLAGRLLAVLERTAGKWGTSLDSFSWRQSAQRFIPKNAKTIAEFCVQALLRRAELGRDDDVSESLRLAIKQGGWEVFRDVVGPAVIESPVLLWKVDSIFANSTIFAEVESDLLMKWIGENVNERVAVVAHNARPHGRPLEGLARSLLEAYGSREEVGSSIAAAFGTGSWWGPMSEHLRSQIEDLEAWAQDSHPNVRSWARELLVRYRQQLREELLREAEEI